MRRMTYFVMALAMMLVFTQCKKDVDTVNPTANSKVDVTFSTGGSRSNITETGVVTWTAGDIIHVYASTTGYLGALTLTEGAGTNSATFAGSISAWTDDETLRFYYLGTNTKKSDNTFVIDYSAQDGTLATIASKYHVSCYTEENVPASKTSFGGQMLNQMALAKFDVSGFGYGNVKIYAESGFRNQITISANGVLSYGVAGVHPTIDNQSGHIVIGVTGAEKYVALLPSDGEITMQFTSQSKTGSDEARTIAANDFIGYSEAVAITASDVSSSYVDLAYSDESHVFTVSYRRTVNFAKGNLVYDQGRFKMHSKQYGRCFTSAGDVSTNYKVSGTFDLFGWGTAGWNNGNLLYMPYTLTGVDGYGQQYGYGYGPTDGSNYNLNLTSLYENSDWGVYPFGMIAMSSWRTLTRAEWKYLIGELDEWGELLTCRDESIRFLIANIVADGNNYDGLIIFPDGFSTVVSEFGIGSYSWNNYNGTVANVTASDWVKMESNGAVFLPAAGCRDGANVQLLDGGYYWSSSANTDHPYWADKLYFKSGDGVTWGGDNLYVGLPVSLVH